MELRDEEFAHSFDANQTLPEVACQSLTDVSRLNPQYTVEPTSRSDEY
jgi:hypothetical protein